MPKIIGEKKINVLVKRFETIENRIHDKVQILNATDTINNSFYNKVRKGISADYEDLRKTTVKWSKKAIPSTYDQNVRIQTSRIKNLKIKPPKTTTYRKLIANQIATSSKAALVSDFDATLLLGLDGGNKTLLRLINYTQQLNVAEKTIDKIVEKGIEKGQSTFTVKKQIQKKLMNQALDKKYITIVNKNGDPMQWTTSKYAEMVARTKLTETQSISTVNTAAGFGSDLIQISSHNTTTRVCLPHEGKIYSISGNSKDFAPLTELPPYHPNCLHTTSVVFRETLEQRGIQKYSDFSLGKTDIHPTRKSHIPTSNLKKRLEHQRSTIQKGNLTKAKKARQTAEVDRKLSLLE